MSAGNKIRIIQKWKILKNIFQSKSFLIYKKLQDLLQEIRIFTNFFMKN